MFQNRIILAGNISSITLTICGLKYNNIKNNRAYSIFCCSLGSTIYNKVVNTPIISFFVLLCSYIWFYTWNNEQSIEKWTISLETCVYGGDYMRIFKSALMHGNFFHLLMNMSTLSGMDSLEVSYGSMTFLMYFAKV